MYCSTRVEQNTVRKNNENTLQACKKTQHKAKGTNENQQARFVHVFTVKCSK